MTCKIMRPTNILPIRPQCNAMQYNTSCNAMFSLFQCIAIQLKAMQCNATNILPINNYEALQCNEIQQKIHNNSLMKCNAMQYNANTKIQHNSHCIVTHQSREWIMQEFSAIYNTSTPWCC